MKIYIKELYHHGILGQKWGKTNGPPYPLKISDHSSSEKKAGWKKSLSKSNDFSKTKKEKKKLTDADKKRITKIALGAIAGAAVIGGTIYLAKSGKLDGLINKGKNAIEGLPEDFKPPVSSSSSTNDILGIAKRVNPTNSNTNCVGCASVMALNRLGIKGTAKDLGRAIPVSWLKSIFKGFEEDYILSDPRSLEDAFSKSAKQILDKNKEGSFGILYGNGNRTHPVGHAIFWEIVNGAVVFADSQKGFLYESISDCANKLSFLDKYSITFATLSNCSIDESKLDLILERG